MTALDGLGGIAVVAMQARAHMAGKRDDCRRSFHIRLVMVSDDAFRAHLCAYERLTKKCLRAHPVPFVTQQHINDLPVLVDGPMT